MRRIEQTGSSFRWGLFSDNGLNQDMCSMYTGINGRIISELLRGRRTFDEKSKKECKLIYGYYADKVLRPISYTDFWCIKKIFEEVK